MSGQGLAGGLGLRAVTGCRLVNPARTVRRAGSYPGKLRTGDGTADGRTRSGRRRRALDGSSRLRGLVPARGHTRDSTGHSWRERRDHPAGPRSRRRQEGLRKIRTRLAFRQMEEGVVPCVGLSISDHTAGGGLDATPVCGPLTARQVSCAPCRPRIAGVFCARPAMHRCGSEHVWGRARQARRCP